MLYKNTDTCFIKIKDTPVYKLAGAVYNNQ